MTEVKLLEQKVERLKKIAIGLKVKLNTSEANVRKLECRLAEARHSAQNTQTMEKLEILCENEFNNGQDPMNTGEYRNPLED